MTRAERMEALLREAADAITLSRPSDVHLVSRIAEFLAEPEMPPCVYCGQEGHWSQSCIVAGLQPLVLESYGAGHAFLRPETAS